MLVWVSLQSVVAALIGRTDVHPPPHPVAPADGSVQSTREESVELANSSLSQSTYQVGGLSLVAALQSLSRPSQSSCAPSKIVEFPSLQSSPQVPMSGACMSPSASINAIA